MQALLVALVVFVLAIRDDARGRRHRQERLLDLHVLQRGLEIIDVARELRLPGIGDRPDADRVARGRHALARVELGIELGETLPIGAAGERVGAGLHRPALEAAQAFEHILRPADRFAELAVTDHVDPGLRLPAHDLGDRTGHAGLIGVLVERLALLLGAQELEQLRRPDQAADMGGENAFGAALHRARFIVG